MSYQKIYTQRYQYIYPSLVFTILLSLLIVACDSQITSTTDGLTSVSELSAVSSSAGIGSLSGTETQITTNPGNQSRPAISGNRIVWEDQRKGFSNTDIYMYDISTGVETQITTDPLNQRFPAISGNRIVWQDTRNGNADIYMFDLSTGVETQITTNRGQQLEPAISGDRIVWRDLRNRSHIYMYDISTGIETQITSGLRFHYAPDISGDRIVYYDLRNGTGNFDIFMYDISTGVETQITDAPGNQYFPRIDGDNIVWLDLRNSNNDIYLYDIASGVETQITTNTETQSRAAVSGDRIVWEDYRLGSRNPDIYVYDISTGMEAQITTNQDRQRFPAIYENYVVYDDNRNDNFDIYLYDLEDVGDTTPPEITFNVLETTLWPPNHKMRLAVSGITATDNVDPDPQLTISVVSNEPSNGTGDGNTEEDWKVVEENDGTYNVYLRAERSGNGEGRTYIVDIIATDETGNTTSEQINLAVAHDQRKL